jgi:hypothetical protein
MGRVGIGLGLSLSVCLFALGCGASHRSGSASTLAGFRSEPVRFLPGGIQTLARGRLVGTAGYSVRAERYRFQHQTHFNLAVNVNEIGGGSQGTNFTPSASMWTILFGVLADPRDRAYAYTTHGRYRLRTAVIPRRFRATGVAAYVALPEQPIRILVTTARDATLMSEKLEPVPNEHCQPNTGIMVLRKRTSGKNG